MHTRVYFQSKQKMAASESEMMAYQDQIEKHKEKIEELKEEKAKTRGLMKDCQDYVAFYKSEKQRMGNLWFSIVMKRLDREIQGWEGKIQQHKDTLSSIVTKLIQEENVLTHIEKQAPVHEASFHPSRVAKHTTSERTTAVSLKTLGLLKWKDEMGYEYTFRLVDRVSEEWRRFGAHLGISSNRLRGWDEQHQGNINKCWNEVMDHWIRSGGTHEYPVTWKSVYTLLVKLECMKAAMILKEAAFQCRLPSN